MPPLIRFLEYLLGALLAELIVLGWLTRHPLWGDPEELRHRP